MTKKLILILTILPFLSCGNEISETTYKTESGEYASKDGNFIIAFPTKPNYTEIENQIGLDKFQVHLFRSVLSGNKIFAMEYLDYPEHMLKSMTDEQTYIQGVTNYSNKMAQWFELKSQKPIKQHGLNGYYFVLSPKLIAINNGVKGNIEGKMFRNGNRVYTLTFMGNTDHNVEIFLNSFRLLD